MLLTRGKILRTPCGSGVWLLWALLAGLAGAPAGGQGVTTTTVQGTVYLATGQPGSGTLILTWPAFTTAAGQAVAADSVTVKIGGDGFVSVSLAPNQGATPAGLYYTAVYDMSDGSTSTEYWVVPAASQATLAQVRAQVMPAAQAVQTVTKSYVDQQVSQLTQSLLTSSGGNLSGPLYLNGDPSQPLEAADKHYVDAQAAGSVPLAGGTMTGALLLNGDPSQDLQAADKRYVDAAAANAWPGAVLRADQFSGADFGAKLQACVNAVSTTYGGTCDARNFSGHLSMAANVTIPAANTSILLPCATIATASQIVIPGGVRNVALHGCAQRGGSAASGSTGGTAFAYSGAGALVQVGDPTYAVDTPGFHMDNLVIDATAAASATAEGMVAYRTQEIELEGVYFLGNADQTGLTLDGTGNYTGGTFLDEQFVGFQTAVNGLGHQTSNPATTDWLNASTFVRVHIACPTANGAPIAGTYGVNLQQGDGNTFTGGDVENCATAVHLGPSAQNNTIVGLRSENSTYQVVADAGSAYNDWITGGTLFTGKLVDNGTRNSFLDSFHRSFNALNGDWYGSQQDATLINHYRLGIGAGNERGLLNRYQTDSGYRWTMGLSDALGGEQYYQILDELNNVNRISIGQYNQGQSSTNDQTVINAAGSGAVVLNGSSNAGTGGVVIGSGGASATTVATISNAGSAQFNGSLQVGAAAQSAGTMTVRNNADAEVDYYLWPGLTTSQKGSFTYKDFNGNSQWYMVKDQSNNWALNSAVGGLDSFKAYQSTNSGDTYVNASNAGGAVRVNYENGSGSSFKIYGGNSSTLYASFTGANAIALPGLAAASGHSCLQIDSSGYITNTGAACGSGGSGTVGTGSTGQIAVYTSNGTTLSGISTVPLSAGGTGASSAAAALQNLGALPQVGGTLTGALAGTRADFSGSVAAGDAQITGAVNDSYTAASSLPVLDLRNPAFAGGAICDGTTNHPIDAAFQAALNQLYSLSPQGGTIRIVGPSSKYCYMRDPVGISWPNFGMLTIELTGNLYTGTTFGPNTPIAVGNGTVFSIIGKGAGETTQFQNAAYPAMIAPMVSAQGTLGTAINPGTVTLTNGSAAVTGAGTNFSSSWAGQTIIFNVGQGYSKYTVASVSSATALTLTTNYNGGTVSGVGYGGVPTTFSPSSLTGLYNGTYISVVDTLTCNISTISRSSGVVTAVFSSACHIPAGSGGLVVAGVTDTSFNGTFTVTSDDYSANTLTWKQGGSDTQSSGGTASGMNSDTPEVQQISCTTDTNGACTGNISASFYEPHTAAATFGIAELVTTSPTILQDLQVQNYDGVAFYGADPNYESHFLRDGFFSGTYPSAAWAAEFDGAYSQFDQCSFNENGWNPWSLRLSNDRPQVLSHGGHGSVVVRDSFVYNGVQIDKGLSEGEFDWDTVDQPSRAFLTYDNSQETFGSIGGLGQFTINHGAYQDTQVGGFEPCVLKAAFDGTTNLDVQIDNFIYPQPGCLTSSNFAGTVRYRGINHGLSYGRTAANGVLGTIDDGVRFTGETSSQGADLGPSVIPYPVLNVPADLTTWANSGCTVTPGLLAPDGTSTAYGVTGYCYLTANMDGAYKVVKPAVGDLALFGGRTYTPQLGQTDSGGGNPFAVTAYPYATLNNSGYVTQYDSPVENQGWHAVVGLAQVVAVTGSGTVPVQLKVNGGGTNFTQEFWHPFLMVIPAIQFTANTDGSTATLTSVSITRDMAGKGILPGMVVWCVSGCSGTPLTIPTNAEVLSTGSGTVTLNLATGQAVTGATFAAQYPLAEVQRWRMELLHGVVPAGWSNPGMAVTVEPIASVPAAVTLTGTSGTATCSQGLQGTQKYTSCYLNGYAQTGTAQTVCFAGSGCTANIGGVNYATTPVLLESGGSCGSYNPTVTAGQLTLPANAAMTAESCNVVVLGQ